MSQAVWGGTPFPDNECNLRRVDDVRRFSRRHLSLSRVVTFYLEFFLQETGAALKAKIDNLRTVFATQYLDFEYKVGGVAIHGLTNAGSLSGVKVIQQSWPKGDGEELATCRTGAVTLQAEYPFADSNIVYWRESIRYRGNGGPSIAVTNTWLGPVASVIYPTTPIRLLQSGKAIGFTSHVAAPPPAFLLSPVVVLHEDQFDIDYQGGEQQGLVACYFGTTWSYPMTALSPPAFTLPTTL